jgi:hypothetical protein
LDICDAILPRCPKKETYVLKKDMIFTYDYSKNIEKTLLEKTLENHVTYGEVLI